MDKVYYKVHVKSTFKVHISKNCPFMNILVTFAYLLNTGNPDSLLICQTGYSNPHSVSSLLPC